MNCRFFSQITMTIFYFMRSCPIDNRSNSSTLFGEAAENNGYGRCYFQEIYKNSIILNPINSLSLAKTIRSTYGQSSLVEIEFS